MKDFFQYVSGSDLLDMYHTRDVPLTYDQTVAYIAEMTFRLSGLDAIARGFIFIANAADSYPEAKSRAEYNAMKTTTDYVSGKIDLQTYTVKNIEAWKLADKSSSFLKHLVHSFLEAKD